MHSTPAILEPSEFYPGHEPVIVEKPNMNRRVSTAHKQQAAQAANPVLAPIDENTGEPLKMMKVPACWTPTNRRANAAFIYIFFRTVCIFKKVRLTIILPRFLFSLVHRTFPSTRPRNGSSTLTFCLRCL